MEKATQHKGSMSRDEALLAGMGYAEMVARAHRKWVRGNSDAYQDLISAGYEAVVLAWDSWSPEKANWRWWATRYANEYIDREVAKSRSVVQTGYDRRKAESDDSIFVTNDEGVEEMMPLPSGDCPAQNYEADQMLKRISDAYHARVQKMVTAPNRPLAEAIISERLLAVEKATVRDLAARFGCSYQQVSNIEKKLTIDTDALLA